MTTTISQSGLIDPLGQLLKITGKLAFRGKGRLINYWLDKRDKNAKRIRILPGGGKVICDFSVPYEAMVWLEQEEQSDLELLTQLLKPGQTFVDCGANIGIWTIVAASAVGSNGRVYAFEPNPFTFEKLSQNISLLTSKEHIKLLPTAVGNENKELALQCHQEHNISQVISTSTNESIIVPVVTLDATFTDTFVDGIKIDVEGYEIEVLQGAETILKKYQPWLIVEFNTVLAKVNTLGDWNVHQYLSKLGYVCRESQYALDSTSTTILSQNWQTKGYCNLYYSMPK
ncbi:FkbM family methyltransferase [Floridanema aerugineum]|jgi:FkbM family methyltransferase|uniref:FkbM family methyltransferase n=1 Tax=Floridaenema aerugineum BLCC-F46 TaxID=3153654 RepID=A0ABV4X534_9CYAN